MVVVIIQVAQLELVGQQKITLIEVLEALLIFVVAQVIILEFLYYR